MVSSRKTKAVAPIVWERATRTSSPLLKRAPDGICLSIPILQSYSFACSMSIRFVAVAARLIGSKDFILSKESIKKIKLSDIMEHSDEIELFDSFGVRVAVGFVRFLPNMVVDDHWISPYETELMCQTASMYSCTDKEFRGMLRRVLRYIQNNHHRTSYMNKKKYFRYKQQKE